MKKIAIGALVLVIGLGIALAVLARTVLTGDRVRAAIAAQVSAAIGQPVTIGGIGASIYPRVTMDLTDVAIGQPASVQLQSMHVGTDLGALFSRRIERAAVRIDRARITMPLPDFATGGSRMGTGAAGPQAGSTPAEGDARPPVEIVSIDEIVLHDVEVVRGNRTLRGDIELVPEGKGVVLRRIELAAEDTKIEMTGTITSLNPVEGRVEATANEVNFDRLLGFLSDFTAVPARRASAPGTASATSAKDSTTSLAETGLDGRLTFVLALGRATTGDLTLSDLRATAQVTTAAVTFEPLTFGVFGGRYEGTMHLSLSDPSRFVWRAKVTGINAADLMRFAKSPDTITGTLAGTIALEGAGLEMEPALRTARGTARIDIANGAIAGLSLVRTIVLATSGRGGYVTSASSALESRGDSAEAERFSRLGATLRLADRVMSTSDFVMTAHDVDLAGAGTVSLATMTTRLDGRVVLSEELSKQGGTDLYRYAQEGGRVTLPATVTGPLGNLSVRIDVAQVAMRAVRNRAAEEAKKAIERNLPARLRGLFPKPPGSRD
jgi:uncharacterized protein involved in outer membrane biogenesis